VHAYRVTYVSTDASPFLPYALVASTYVLFFFFFNAPATTEIYTLSLHDALPIFSGPRPACGSPRPTRPAPPCCATRAAGRSRSRSEEHTSELQSLTNLVCRLLLEKKKTNTNTRT